MCGRLGLESCKLLKMLLTVVLLPVETWVRLPPLMPPTLKVTLVVVAQPAMSPPPHQRCIGRHLQ